MTQGFDPWLKVLGRTQRSVLPAAPEEGQRLVGIGQRCRQLLGLRGSHGRGLRLKGGARCTLEETKKITAWEMQQLPGLGWLSGPQIKMD